MKLRLIPRIITKSQRAESISKSAQDAASIIGETSSFIDLEKLRKENQSFDFISLKRTPQKSEQTSLFKRVLSLFTKKNEISARAKLGHDKSPENLSKKERKELMNRDVKNIIAIVSGGRIKRVITESDIERLKKENQSYDFLTKE